MQIVAETGRKRALAGMTLAELRALARELREAEYRGGQIADWVYRRCVNSIEEMTNLPSAFRERLAEECTVGLPEVAATQRSKDGTIKLLLRMADGNTVESVYLPYEDRISCCISSQVGCPVRCAFCATGLSGYARNLTPGEVVGQVLRMQQTARTGTPAGEESPRISHVVFMGMGEPLFNYDTTMKSLGLLNREVGLAMRRMTVSTVGFVPGIRRLTVDQPQITLAISLHAPNDVLRKRLIPTMHQWGVAEIMDACREYVAATNRRVTFEYCLLDGVNDGTAEAEELAALLQGLLCHVNLIPYNAVGGTGFRAPSAQRVKDFYGVLSQAGLRVTQRVQRGADVDAACGQLRRAEQTAATGG
ncbi:MAG: 23S rRNA (adenine(2503)-C(2))-methyltransferase RlmN [Dehalococcoidia bacterium]|nr:23S rRNA (adenine(2503)-C(2))-methyltransferase RlmN [Dehalococcoidia bacterium]